MANDKTEAKTPETEPKAEAALEDLNAPLGVTKLPKGVTLANHDFTIEGENGVVVKAKPAPPFSDENAGNGGVYAIDPETGERQPVWEAYQGEDAKGKPVTMYRPVA